MLSITKLSAFISTLIIPSFATLVITLQVSAKTKGMFTFSFSNILLTTFRAMKESVIGATVSTPFTSGKRPIL
ncbi:ORF149 [White spot syndrome virus]|uniref:Wsv084 n=3 Tax=White spot syndrome virus TaxID=342409 RepID=Q8VB96_WSSVS|nr:wsv084 [Shrimp white spot syndrome virus]AFX59461.1 wsv084 [White spot syndrome virus]AAL33088.1 wsv084 [Shrimp white spot syndrome virus]AAL89009.1 WSSV141 [Shrimp white spot syndrome virus]ATU83951.1 ORF149 [White spot syndrome virus]AWQ60273.1 wsv084 [Shrimp white spot syndrome virus]